MHLRDTKDKIRAENTTKYIFFKPLQRTCDNVTKKKQQ